MTRKEKIALLIDELDDIRCDNFDANTDEDKTLKEAVRVIKALEQESCEIIKEIPKDYKYDTETEDFLVYRHMYTGREIHIEKPVPRYRLEQEPCDDVTTFKEDVLDAISRIGLQKSDPKEVRAVAECLRSVEALPPVTAEQKPQQKMGQWILTMPKGAEEWCYKCSKCGFWKYKKTINLSKFSFCPNCGQPKMQEVEE